MIRATQAIFSVLTQQSLNARSLPFLRSPLMRFSTSPSNVLQLMNGRVDHNIANKIFVGMSSMGEKDRREALRKFIDQVYQRKIDIEHLSNQKLRVHLKKEPELLFEAYFYKIGDALQRLQQLISSNQGQSKKVLAKEINDAFVICFDAVKRQQSTDAPLKQIELYKLFAHYNGFFLSQMIEPAKVKTCLIKAKDLYKGCMTKIMMNVKQILNEQKKVESSLTFQETIDLTTSDKQAAISAAKQTNFMLFQYFSECLLEMVGLELHLYEMESGEDLSPKRNPLPNQKEAQKPVEGKLDQSQIQKRLVFPKNIGQLQPIMEKALNNYILVKEHIHKSQFYYKLKKMYTQLAFQNKIRKDYEMENPTDRQAAKKKTTLQFGEQMRELFREAAADFQKIVRENQEPGLLAEHCALMAEVKINCFVQGEDQAQKVMKEMGEDLQSVFNEIPDDRLRKEIVNHVCKHIKDLFEIDISSFLETVPRALRNPRPPRTPRKKNKE